VAMAARTARGAARLTPTSVERRSYGSQCEGKTRRGVSCSPQRGTPSAEKGDE
jgi:hypothetical protein